MKQKLFLLLLLFVSGIAVAETSTLTVQDLQKGGGQFLDTKDYFKEQFLKWHTEDGMEVELKDYEIRNILELNVVSYFKLGGYYDTDLKRELFKETDEYKQYESKLKKIRDDMKKSSFYYIHKLNNNYNLENSGFLYEIELYEGNYAGFPGYINHETLCIEYATKRFAQNKIDVRKRWGGSDYFYNQRVYLPVKDKRIALRIEEAGRNQVGVLFLFKLDKTKDVKMSFSTHTFILTKTEGIYIVNTQTGEVYCKVL